MNDVNRDDTRYTLRRLDCLQIESSSVLVLAEYRVVEVSSTFGCSLIVVPFDSSFLLHT